MTNSNRPQPRAFTLLEMILAMAMVAMLSGALYMSLTTAFKARDSAQAAVAPMRTATVAMDLVRQDLESVPAPGPAEDPVALAGPFIGYAQAGGQGGAMNSNLTFCSIGRDLIVNPIALAQPQPHAEGIRRIELGVRTDATPPALVRRVYRNLLSQATAEPEEEILCRNVRSFMIRYYDGTAWQPEWDSTLMGDTLPAAIEITLEIDRDPETRDPRPYQITRVFPLACSKPYDAAQAGGIQ